ncbi:MAG: hypothetical protein IGS23_00065 [Rivularia sp. T60_A2020_040]|nr:hypothetical protein [Rivularia sp. T60_A2020_040]
MDNLIKQEILTQLDSEEQFPVDFNIYWQWLEFSTKGNAKRAFEKAGFTMGQDFDHIIISDNMVKRSGWRRCSVRKTDADNRLC